MKFLLAFLSLCLVSGHTSLVTQRSEWDFVQSARELLDSQWNEFKLTYNKQYKDETEELHRKRIFAEKSIEISKRNQLVAKRLVFTPSGINQFSDLTFDEFFKTYANCSEKITQSEIAAIGTFIPPAHVTYPDQVDWREKGAVTNVKNQLRCGSCYSFASTGALEAQHFRKNKELVSLSEQNIVDCSVKDGNHGCDGGNAIKTYQYIARNQGIDTEDSYRYKGVQGKCRYNPANKGADDRGVNGVVGEDNLKAAVATVGPMFVNVNVQQSLKDFKPGTTEDVTKVYYEPRCDPEDRTHAVLVVGYGTDPKDPHPDYWIVKNSWAETWGDRGYIKMARNVDNDCGISAVGVYPLV